MRAVPYILIALALVGCTADDLTGPLEPERKRLPAPEGEIRIIVDIVDEAGQPFRPYQVWWYYPPDDQTRGGSHRHFPRLS